MISEICFKIIQWWGMRNGGVQMKQVWLYMDDCWTWVMVPGVTTQFSLSLCVFKCSIIKRLRINE